MARVSQAELHASPQAEEQKVLRVRQLIPPLTLLTPEGETIRAWDFMQKNNLVIGFLDAQCSRCAAFVQAFSAHAGELREKEAKALFVVPDGFSRSRSSALSAEVIVGADIDNQSARRSFGEVVPSAQRPCRGLFVTDRYGELSSQWIVVRGHEFPVIQDVLGALDLLDIACEECFPPHCPRRISMSPRLGL